MLIFFAIYKSIKDVMDDLFGFTKDRFFIGEQVKVGNTSK